MFYKNIDHINLIEFPELELLGVYNHRCCYLMDREQSLYYYTKEKTFTAEGYRKLIDRGFRRAGNQVYLPVCKNCWECQILRVNINLFKKNKTQRRIWNRGQREIIYKIQNPEFTIEKMVMYLNYLNQFHNQNHKIESILNDRFLLFQHITNYKSFFVETCLKEDLTKELNLYIKDQLVGVGIFDIVDNGISSVYFFYHPMFKEYRLGTYSVMLEIEIARQLHLDYYYPGYYIENCSKMSYKKDFRPYEIKKIYEKKYRDFIK